MTINSERRQRGIVAARPPETLDLKVVYNSDPLIAAIHNLATAVADLAAEIRASREQR